MWAFNGCSLSNSDFCSDAVYTTCDSYQGQSGSGLWDSGNYIAGLHVSGSPQRDAPNPNGVAAITSTEWDMIIGALNSRHLEACEHWQDNTNTLKLYTCIQCNIVAMHLSLSISGHLISVTSPIMLPCAVSDRVPQCIDTSS